MQIFLEAVWQGVMPFQILLFLQHISIRALGQRLSNVSMHQRHLEECLKHLFLDPTSRVSDSVVLVWGPKICISNKVLGDSNTARLGKGVVGTI